MATKKQSRPIVEGLANPRGVTAVYGTPIDWGSLPEKIRIGRRIANGRFKLEAHYPAKYFNDKKEYIDKRKAGSYCRFYDNKSPFFIARTVWDATSHPGMHMVVKNRNETYRFIVTPKANDPTEATVIGAYLVHRQDGVPVLCSGPIGELKAIGDDGDFKVTAYKKHGIRCPKKDSSGKDLAGEIPKTFGYTKRTSKKGPRKTAKDYCKPSHTFKHPTDIKRAEVVEEMDAYMDEQCTCLMCNWSGAYSDLAFLDDTAEGGPPGMDFMLVCPSCGDGDWLDDMMAEGYDEPCFSCDGIGTWDDGECEYCHGSGMMSDNLRAEMAIYNSEYFDADCGCFKKAETLVWEDKTLSFMDWAKQEEASHLKKYRAETFEASKFGPSDKDYIFVAFDVTDGEREYSLYTILPKSHADSSGRELIEWMYGSVGEEEREGEYWVDGVILVKVATKEPITTDLKTTLNGLGLYAESLSNGEEVIQSMEDTFNAPYAGPGATMDIGKDTALSSFTPEELTTSSAIHGDFDQASLDYSGHQNIEVRAETDAELWKTRVIADAIDTGCFPDDYAEWVSKRIGHTSKRFDAESFGATGQSREISCKKCGYKHHCPEDYYGGRPKSESFGAEDAETYKCKECGEPVVEVLKYAETNTPLTWSAPILTREDYDELDEKMLFMVSSWWNECDYRPHILQPLAQYLTPVQLQQFQNDLGNEIWPEMEDEFAMKVMEYLEGYVIEDDEDDWDAESFGAETFAATEIPGHTTWECDHCWELHNSEEEADECCLVQCKHDGTDVEITEWGGAYKGSSMNWECGCGATGESTVGQIEWEIDDGELTTTMTAEGYGKRQRFGNRYVARNTQGEFISNVGVGASLKADRRNKSKTPARSGFGNKGDSQKTPPVWAKPLGYVGALAAGWISASMIDNAKE